MLLCRKWFFKRAKPLAEMILDIKENYASRGKKKVGVGINLASAPGGTLIRVFRGFRGVFF